MTLRTKLILSFSIVIIVGVFLSAVVGVHLIGSTIVSQAQDKVRLDLNSAREVYLKEAESIMNTVRLTALRFFIQDTKQIGNREALAALFDNIRERESLDFLVFVDERNQAIVPFMGHTSYQEQTDDDFVKWVKINKKAVVSTQIISGEELSDFNPDLALRAKINLIPTPKARPRNAVEETSGMVIKAAAPVFDRNGELVGILYGGRLLNRNFEIVDKVKDIVYRGEQYKDKDIGTATIFLDDLRISTNVVTADGSRAIGTRVSEEVYDQVVVRGIPWIGRAFVVNAWYRTAYEPIRDIKGRIIGMLYVGILEEPYVDLRNRVIVTFLGIALLSVIILFVIAYFSATRITRPINALLFATDKIAHGELSHRVNIDSSDEIGQLGKSFNHMTSELQKATEELVGLTKTLEKKVREKTDELEKAQDSLIESEKLASLGKLAAGIAHEINNPLTSILINSHLLAEQFQDRDKLARSLNIIIDETERCSKIVKGLLQFSRQSLSEKTLTNINELIQNTLLLFDSQVLVSNVRVETEFDDRLPQVMVDGNKIKQVFTNLILNALDAMPEGGTLFISSRLSDDRSSIEIAFKDTGCGIDDKHIGKIFDPFFSTKGVKGTGLGLSVSYGIVKQHDGCIDARSILGHGTTMTIILPVQTSDIDPSRS
jgi:two-component system NtrC family sensor kinase